MFAATVLTAAVRRWYVFLVGLLATAALVGFAYVSVPPLYEIHGTAVLLPGSSTVPIGGNGFLYLGGLNPALEVLLRSINSDETSRQLLGSAPTEAKYRVDHDPQASGPIMLVTATSTSAASARAILDSVLEKLPKTLSTLQTDVSVPDPSQMSVLRLAVDHDATALTSDRTRTVLGAGVVGLVGSFMLAGLLDGLLLSARRRRLQAAGGKVAAADSAAPVADGSVLAAMDTGELDVSAGSVGTTAPTLADTIPQPDRASAIPDEAEAPAISPADPSPRPDTAAAPETARKPEPVPRPRTIRQPRG
ncbi:MAG: hypothetical protein H7279_03865 [Microbacteriaceae bacterium]|nr:hypothetical protein [Microbacteriaceae bacterium]